MSHDNGVYNVLHKRMYFLYLCVCVCVGVLVETVCVLGSLQRKEEEIGTRTLFPRPQTLGPLCASPSQTEEDQGRGSAEGSGSGGAGTPSGSRSHPPTARTTATLTTRSSSRAPTPCSGSRPRHRSLSLHSHVSQLPPPFVPGVPGWSGTPTVKGVVRTLFPGEFWGPQKWYLRGFETV